MGTRLLLLYVSLRKKDERDYLCDSCNRIFWPWQIRHMISGVANWPLVVHAKCRKDGYLYGGRLL